MKKQQADYLTHDVMTNPEGYRSLISLIPKELSEIVKIVQNIMIHQHWCKRYGIELTVEQQKEPFLRKVTEKMAVLQQRGLTNITQEWSNEQKLIGICRDFSVLATALCREAGIPARARCGFADYLEAGKYIDHWVLEYWKESEKRWVLVDAQLDELQQLALNIAFDPLDIPKGHFLTGPQAWQHCRLQQRAPENFGIFDWWGYTYLRCNLLLDANSLLGRPMQPWDDWPGHKALPLEKWTTQDYLLLDELAEKTLNCDQDYATFNDFMQSHDTLRVPDHLVLEN